MYRVYPCSRRVFVAFALIAYWLAVRMHILSLDVFLFSLSHTRPRRPGWEHDDISVLIFYLFIFPPPLTDCWQLVKPCPKTWELSGEIVNHYDIFAPTISNDSYSIKLNDYLLKG